MYEKLPTELKEKALFCLWKHEPNGKVPYQINGCKAKATDKKSFSDYKSVIGSLDGYDGIGIGIFDGFCAIDIDHCIKNGSFSIIPTRSFPSCRSKTGLILNATAVSAKKKGNTLKVLMCWKRKPTQLWRALERQADLGDGCPAGTVRSRYDPAAFSL